MDFSWRLFCSVTRSFITLKLRSWDSKTPHTQKLGNIYIYILFLFLNISSAAASISSGFATQSPLFGRTVFLHIQNIWTKLYYLLYNINNKIFAFLLLSTDVLYALQLNAGTAELQKWTHRILNSKRRWTVWTCWWRWCVCVCVTFKWWNIHLNPDGRSSPRTCSQWKNAWKQSELWYRS